MLFCSVSVLPLLSICPSSLNDPFFGASYLALCNLFHEVNPNFSMLSILDHRCIIFIRFLQLRMSHKLIVSKMVNSFRQINGNICCIVIFNSKIDDNIDAVRDAPQVFETVLLMSLLTYSCVLLNYIWIVAYFMSGQGRGTFAKTPLEFS